MSTDLVDGFVTFHNSNPHVYQMFDKFTHEAAKRCDAFAVDAVFQRLRWFTLIETISDDGFKLNDHHAAFYARLWMLRNPGYNTFFRIRKSIADQFFQHGEPACLTVAK